MVLGAWARWCHASFTMVESRLEASQGRGRSHTRDWFERNRQKPQLRDHMLKSLHSKTPYHSKPVLTRNLSLLFWVLLVGGLATEPLCELQYYCLMALQLNGTSLRLSCRNRHGCLALSNQKHWLLRIHNALRPDLLALSYNYHIPHTQSISKHSQSSIEYRNHQLIGNKLFLKWRALLNLPTLAQVVIQKRSPRQFDERNDHRMIDYSWFLSWKHHLCAP